MLWSYDTHEGKVTDNIPNHWTLVGTDNGNHVVRNADLEEGNDPNNSDDKQSYERRYLEFDIVAELNEPQGQDQHESDLFVARVVNLRI